MDRCLHILKEGPHIQIATINDAIEAHQLKLTFETVPELFKEAEVGDIASAVATLFANACKYTSETLASSGILDIYEEVEMAVRHSVLEPAARLRRRDADLRRGN